MTLEGAINLNETNDYIIYTMNSVTSGQYGVVIPKNTNLTMNMLVDVKNANVSFSELVDILDKEGERLGVNIRIQREDIFDAMHRI